MGTPGAQYLSIPVGTSSSAKGTENLTLLSNVYMQFSFETDVILGAYLTGWGQIVSPLPTLASHYS